MGITSFRELEAWQVGMTLVTEVYRLTAQFPRHELSGLTTQLRRAASSIPSNVAEGSRQRTTAALTHYLRQALASGAEVETQLEIARRVGYRSEEEIRVGSELAVRVAMMLNKLVSNLERSRS